VRPKAPASPHAIVRRACPYRGENNGPSKDAHRELNPGPELGVKRVLRVLLVCIARSRTIAPTPASRQGRLVPAARGSWVILLRRLIGSLL
jgi:hypothetical protein